MFENILKKEKDYVIIVGCGKLGAKIAEDLSGERKSIVLIDKDENAFKLLSDNFSGFMIEADGVEEDTLISANIERAGMVFATTDNDNTNIMIAQIAKYIYNVPTVIARVYEPSRQEVYKKFGIDTISPIQLSTEEFKKIISDRENTK